MQDHDGLPRSHAALQHIDADLAAVIDADGLLGHPQSLIGTEHHVCRLLPQQRCILHISVAGQYQQTAAVLIVSQPVDLHEQIVMQIRCKGHGHLIAHLPIPGLIRGNHRHIVPGAA